LRADIIERQNAHHTNEDERTITMKIRSLVAGFILGAAAAIATGAALSAQDRTAAPPQQPSPEEMQKMMQQWMEAMKPGEAHKHLMRDVGNWDMTMRVWMDPAAPPATSKGTSEVKSVIGGRFILQTVIGEMPMPDPATGKNMQLEGMGLSGYDNYQNMYIGCWVDNMGTQMLTMRGQLSPDGKTMTMYGEMDEPMLNVRGRMVKYVTKWLDDDTHVFNIYDLHAGDDHKVFEIEYKRKK
jgi:hypothetical protein